MNIITMLMSVIYGAWEALKTLGVSKDGRSYSSLPQVISALVLRNGMECTPELQYFPDIRTGLTDSTFKMIVLRNGTGSIGIAVTLPSGQSGSINWGDGNTTTLTASGALVTYTHTWTSWLTSGDGLSQYNIITVSGNITALRAATGGSYSRYWQSVVWIAGKCSALTDFQFALASGGTSLYPYGLRRFELDAVNCLLQRFCFYGANNLKYFAYNGGYATTYGGENSYLFYGSAVDEIIYSNSGALNLSSAFSTGRNQKLNISASTLAAVNASNMCDGNTTLRHVSLNFAWGNFYRAFYNCFMLKEIDLSGCPVNGITDATGWTGLWNCTKILFPSYIDTDGIRKPKPYPSGMTSMGNVDISGSGLDRDGLVKMFYSLPTNAATRNLTITGSVGAADLTAGELAIANGKNWVVIRA